MSLMLNKLRRIKTLVGIKKDVKSLHNIILKHKRKKAIKDYFHNHLILKLHLGSNKTIMNSWLCSDLVPQNNQSIFLDVTEKFPFRDNSFDYIFSEHLIEHLTQEEGLFMLQESYRVLKVNGRIRIATPDMETIIRLYSERRENFGEEYIKWSTDHFTTYHSGYDPVVVVNTLFHEWKHQFLYDFNFLKNKLSECGFKDIERLEVSLSNDANLLNIEKHHENVGSFEMVKFETLVVEAVKK